jgi:hypothetical protein
MSVIYPRLTPTDEGRIYFVSASLLALDLVYAPNPERILVAAGIILWTLFVVSLAHTLHPTRTGQVIFSILIFVLLTENAVLAATTH